MPLTCKLEGTGDLGGGEGRGWGEGKKPLLLVEGGWDGWLVGGSEGLAGV